jgi:chromosome segregation ATPase
MSGRISGLKNKIATLRVRVISLEMSPDNQYLKLLKNEILSLKQEGQCKQVIIDSLEFDVSKREKRIKSADEIIIKLGEEIALLKQKESCSKEDVDYLVEKLYGANKHLKGAEETIDKLSTNIKMLNDKKIKNRLKKLFIS